jgi:hypothetical protein
MLQAANGVHEDLGLTLTAEGAAKDTQVPAELSLLHCCLHAPSGPLLPSISARI